MKSYHHKNTTFVAIILFLGLLSACNGESGLPRLGGSDESDNQISASGFLEAEEVSIVSEAGGRVAAVRVDQGADVSAGDAVIILDDRLLQSDRLQAEAAVSTALANLDSLLAGVTEEEVKVAEAFILQAEASLTGAQRLEAQAWSSVNNPSNVNLDIAAVRIEITEYSRQIEAIEAKISEVQYELDEVRSDDEPLDYTRIDFLSITLNQLNAQLASVQALYNGAARRLELLQAQKRYPLVLLAEAHRATAQAGIAEAQVSLARAQYDLVIAPPLTGEVAIAQAQVDLAEAQVALIDAKIAQLTLTAPLDGVVTTRAVSPGETAVPGIPLLTIANLSELKIVIYIPETRIGLLTIGMPADITVDTYPERVFEGQITKISDEAEFTPRNVQTEEERVNLVFAVEIRIDNVDRRLKPGMPADVVINTGR